MKTFVIPHSVLSVRLEIHPESTLAVLREKFGPVEYRRSVSKDGGPAILRCLVFDGITDRDATELANSFAHDGKGWWKSAA